MKSSYRLLSFAAVVGMASGYASVSAAQPADRHGEIRVCKRAYAKSAKDRAAEAKLSACLARIRFDGDFDRYKKKRS